jgi:hypothetical protein
VAMPQDAGSTALIDVPHSVASGCCDIRFARAPGVNAQERCRGRTALSTANSLGEMKDASLA